MSDLQRTLISVLVKRPYLTAKELALIVGNDAANVTHSLERLMNLDVVKRRTGSGKHFAYEYSVHYERWAPTNHDD